MARATLIDSLEKRRELSKKERDMAAVHLIEVKATRLDLRVAYVP